MKKSDDDVHLWVHVTRSVKAYGARRKEKSVAPQAVPARRRAAPPAEPPPRKSRDVIDGRLDLHGLTQEAAFAALCRFVHASAAQERRLVLVITGKGRVSEGGGVLRRLLPLWCESATLRDFVISAAPAPPRDGGDGAFYVRLRRAR